MDNDCAALLGVGAVPGDGVVVGAGLLDRVVGAEVAGGEMVRVSTLDVATPIREPSWPGVPSPPLMLPTPERVIASVAAELTLSVTVLVAMFDST